MWVGWAVAVVSTTAETPHASLALSLSLAPAWASLRAAGTLAVFDSVFPPTCVGPTLRPALQIRNLAVEQRADASTRATTTEVQRAVQEERAIHSMKESDLKRECVILVPHAPPPAAPLSAPPPCMWHVAHGSVPCVLRQ